jgi:hypothetical protein
VAGYKKHQKLAHTDDAVSKGFFRRKAEFLFELFCILTYYFSCSFSVPVQMPL